MDLMTDTQVIIASVAVLAAFGGLYKFFENKIEHRVRMVEEETDALAAELKRHEVDLTAHKVQTANSYVTQQALQQMEGRLAQAVDRLADRLDRILEASQKG